MQRTAFYDNLKFVLIALVLIGHFTGPIKGDCFELGVLWRWIYLFHMPAFLFVGGMFAKKLYVPDTGLRINVIAYYLLLFVLFYTGLWAEQHLWNPDPPYDLVNVGSIPWYFVAMAALGASLPIIAKIRGGAKTVIPLSIVIAVLAPLNDNFGDFLVLGRICAYAPFYYAGYFASINGYVAWTEKQRRRIWPIALAIGCMIALYLALYLLPKPITGTMSGLATGHNTYSSMKEFPSRIDMLIRLLDIGIASIMIAALSIVVPSRACLITGLGSRTLQVYVAHPFIYYPLTGFGVFAHIEVFMPAAGWVVAAASVLLAALLAAPKWPDKAFRALRGRIHVDNAEQ